MSKMSQLKMELDELRKCGETLIGISESLKELFSGNVEKTKEEMPETKEPEKKALTLAQVRAVLAEKSRDGFTKEVKAILVKHGAEKLSGIDPAEYEALLLEVEVLGNG